MCLQEINSLHFFPLRLLSHVQSLFYCARIRHCTNALVKLSLNASANSQFMQSCLPLTLCRATCNVTTKAHSRRL